MTKKLTFSKLSVHAVARIDALLNLDWGGVELLVDLWVMVEALGHMDKVHPSSSYYLDLSGSVIAYLVESEVFKIDSPGQYVKGKNFTSFNDRVSKLAVKVGKQAAYGIR